MLFHYYYLQKNPTQPNNIPCILNHDWFITLETFFCRSIIIIIDLDKIEFHLLEKSGHRDLSWHPTEADWSVVKFIESNGKNGFRMTVRMLCHVAGLYTVHYVLFQKSYRFYTKLCFSSVFLLIISSITLYVEVHNLLNIVYINKCIPIFE